jgi:hypothetical protein
MAIIKYGNPLAGPLLQPGWTVDQDGFGLIQVSAKYRFAKSLANQFTTFFQRGITPAPAPFNYCKMWRGSLTEEKGEIMVANIEFAGIDPAVGGGLATNAQVAMTAGSSSEPIEHHPNFLQVFCESGGLSSPLAGFPSATGWDPSTTTNPNRALWTPKVANNGATQGQQFVGFLPNQDATEVAAGNINIKAGIKNYYKPQLTLRVLRYMANKTDALTLGSYVGWNTDGGPFGLDADYKKYAQSGGYAGTFEYTGVFEAKINRTFLVTNCSVEVYGSIYKVQADLMLSGISGWDPDIYPSIQG